MYKTNCPWPFLWLGTVNTSASDGAGGWFIGGNFSHVGGLPRYGLAHILADGNVSDWQTICLWCFPINCRWGYGLCFRSLYRNKKIERIGIAAIDMDGKPVTSWHPQVGAFMRWRKKMELFISG